MKRIPLIAAAVLAGALALTGCTTSTQQGQQTTEDFAKKFTASEPYPLAQVNDSSERANLRERLLRMNDPHKIGYLYELTQQGQVIAQYTIKGKVTSTASQLTNTNVNVGSGAVVDSMSDDGSYGPSEGGTSGVFFFTTSGVLVEYDGLWQYSDAPLNLTSKPLITVDESAKPSSTAGQLK